MTPGASKRLLQLTIAILALVPLLAGGAGVVLGPDFLDMDAPWPPDLDSQVRFLSGVFLVIALGWYSCIPDLEHRTARFRLLAAMVVAGGLARLVSLIVAGAPSRGHLVGLGLELVIVPLLVLWQGRVAARAA